MIEPAEIGRGGAMGSCEWDLLEWGRSHCPGPWLQQFDTIIQTATAQPTPQRVLLLAKDPEIFIKHLVLANDWAQRSPLWLFLGNPHWAAAEQQAAVEQICPHQIWGDHHPPQGITNAQNTQNAQADPKGGSFLKHDQSYVAIATGGSSGKLKFAMHTWSSLRASVQGFCAYFKPESDRGKINSFCTLPLFHVSGLMQFLRCAWSGGTFQWGSYPKDPIVPFPKLPWIAASQPTSNPPTPNGFISLVPTQLARLLDNPGAIAWLKQFRVILLGGAPAWPELLERSRRVQLPLAPTYGMTETAAQVATLKPDDFLAGKTSVGQPLPHVQLKIAPPNPEGPILLQTPSLAAGYWRGEALNSDGWLTGDLGRLDPAGYLSVLGRRDDVILTGGENVMPQEVEAAILATGQVADVCVVGLPDPDWGQRVVAVWVPGGDHRKVGELTLDQWNGLLGDRLSRYKHPKTWKKIHQLPRNNRGKLNRSAITQWCLGQKG